MDRGGNEGNVQWSAVGVNGQPVCVYAQRHTHVAKRCPNASTRNMNLSFPYQIDGRGRSREARRDEDNDEYIRGLIEQVLFTAPGERVMRPDFGSGLRQLLFAGNSPELASTTQMLAQGALQQWLGHLIVIESVVIEAIDSALHVEVIYLVRRTREQQQANFKRGTQ